MTDFEERIERMQADGVISTEDADTVLEFAGFLREAGPIHPKTPEDVSRRRRALIKYADLCGLSREQVETLQDAENAYQAKRVSS